MNTKLTVYHQLPSRDSSHTNHYILGGTDVGLLADDANFDPTVIPQDGNQRIVLQCQSSKSSAQAAQKMFEAGFSEVFHLQGGLPTWKAAGYPTEVNKNAPISMFRQVQIVAGSLVFLGTVLGAFVSPWFLILSGLVGGGLVFAGVSNTCAMAMLLAKLPYNQKAVNTGEIVL